MKNKLKLLYIMLILSSISYSKDNTVDKIDKFNSNLIVQGEGIRERIDYTLYPHNIKLIPNNATPEEIKKIKEENQKELSSHQKFNYETNTIENGLFNGKEDSKLAVYAENGSTVHNIGRIFSYNQKINTNYGGVLLTGIDNPLIRNDNLIALKGNSNFYTNFLNDGQIEMGATEHVLATPINVAGIIPTATVFADYGKCVVNAGYSNIENNGTITMGIDSTKYIKGLDIGVLNGGSISSDRRILNLQQGSVKNTGLINLERMKQFEIIEGVALDLLQIGVHFYRDDYGINLLNEPTLGSVEKSINSGKIFVGGDIYSQGYSGIGISALGSDFKGEHNKFGVSSKNSTFINTGIIEVERDLAKAYDDNNNIVDLYLFYKNFLKLGLLSFSNLTETSIGASISGGEFYNNGGTILVGVNESKNFGTQLRKGAGIAVLGDNKANIYFNTDTETKKPILNTIDKDGKIIETKSTINLEGIHVYATWLEDSSTAIFNGLTEINFNMPPIHLPDNATEQDKKKYEEIVRKYEKDRNKEIFHTDATSKVVINGTIKANGDFSINNQDNNIEIGGNYVYRPLPNGGHELVVTPAKIISSGKIGLNGNIKFDTINFVGMSQNDINKHLNHEYIKAEGGIEGNGNIISNSYLFDLETNKTDNSISLTNINRKDFNSIVENKELGNLLEFNYNNSLNENLEFYKYLALGEDYSSFSEKLNEISGIDNITTLETQVIDITKDLNEQYRNFTKFNKNEGIVFSYLNSKSEINETEKYDGFKRKSSGIMTGYNKNISEKERIGAGFSYVKSNIDYTGNSSNEVETWNIRGYSEHKFKNLNLLNDLSFGYNKSENKRHINGKLNNGEVNSYTLGLNNSIYKNYEITNKLTITPNINMDFTYYYQDDYEEGKEKFSVCAKQTDRFNTTFGLGTEFKYDILAYDNNKISLVGGANYSYDILNGEKDIDLTINNLGSFAEEKREIDKDAFSYSFGINYDYNELYSGQIKYTKELINDIDNEKISVDFSYKF